MRARAIIVIMAIICLGMVGCASTPKLNTPSSKPEVTIPNAEKTVVIDAITNAMINRGYTIKDFNDYSIVFSKEIDSFGANWFYGCKHGSPEARINFAIMGSNQGVRVVIDLTVASAPGTRFEKVDQSPSTNTLDPEEFQRMLEEMAKILLNRNEGIR